MKAIPPANPKANEPYEKIKKEHLHKEDTRANPPLGGDVRNTYRFEPNKESAPTQERAIPKE